MGLTWPAALAGLFAASIPLLIHLLQRGEYRRIDVATTRFLVERQNPRWRRLRIRQPWLLALRLALVILCVLLLAEPYVRGASESQDAYGWTLVSPRVAAEAARQLAPPDSQLRWLAPGFAPLGSDPPPWQAGATWSLLGDADRDLAPGRALQIIAPADSAGLSARRPALSRPVTWLAAPAGGAAPVATRGIDIEVIAPDIRSAQATRVIAALDAWRDAGLTVAYKVAPNAPATLTAAYTIWLSDQPIPQSDADLPRVVLTNRRPFADDAQVIGFSPAARPDTLEHRVGAVTIRTIIDESGRDDSNGDDQFARRLLWQLLGNALWQPPPDYPVNDAQRPPRVLEQAAVARSVRRPLSATLILLVLGTALLERLASTLRAGEHYDR